MANSLVLLNLIGRSNIRKLLLNNVKSSTDRSCTSKLRLGHQLSRSFQSQVRQHLKTIKGSHTKKTQLLFGGGSCLLVGLGYVSAVNFDSQSVIAKIKDLCLTLLQRFFAHCEENKPQKNRTAHYEDTIGGKKKSKKADSFDWAEFFRLIYAEKWYFLLAVAVNKFNFSHCQFLYESNGSFT